MAGPAQSSSTRPRPSHVTGSPPGSFEASGWARWSARSHPLSRPQTRQREEAGAAARLLVLPLCCHLYSCWMEGVAVGRGCHYSDPPRLPPPGVRPSRCALRHPHPSHHSRHESALPRLAWWMSGRQSNVTVGGASAPHPQRSPLFSDDYQRYGYCLQNGCPCHSCYHC